MNRKVKQKKINQLFFQRKFLQTFIIPGTFRITVEQKLVLPAVQTIKQQPASLTQGFPFHDKSPAKQSPEYTASMKKAEAIEGIVSLTRLEGLLDRHPYDLSGGEQQRLALAKVLLLQPRLLLMDEPTNGLECGIQAGFGKDS